jgi:predicted metal-dependent hydrolase
MSIAIYDILSENKYPEDRTNELTMQIIDFKKRPMIQQKDKVKYGTTTIPYYIIKTRRIKTSELIVDADTITVRTPYDKDKTEIQRLILDKASWILEKQKEYRETIPQVTKPSFKEEDSTLPYLGRNYPLNILKKQSKNSSIEFVNGEFVFRLKSSKNSSALIQKLYQDWLIDNAQCLFKDRVEGYSQKLGVKPKRIAIKKLKDRWGSITKEHLVNINVNLLKTP